MENKIVNKQIPITTIIDIANYFDSYMAKYADIFEKEREKNKGLAYSERNYEYENGSAEVRYTVKFHNGKNMTETDYNWFIEMLSEARAIEEIIIDLRVAYHSKDNKEDYNNQYNSVNASVDFRDARMDLKYSDVYVDVRTTNQENEAHNIYSTILNTLEDNEERFDKTIRSRKIRMQSLCISVGIVLSYVLFLILKINSSKLPEVLLSYMNNKYFIVFGQWFVAILLGNVFSYWYMLSLYRPLLPSTRYAGYSRSSNKSIYTDDINDYVEHSEVQIGKFWDAGKRREKIEKIYKITSKIVLAQLLISVILFFVIK